jgi:hypothetical protein
MVITGIERLLVVSKSRVIMLLADTLNRFPFWDSTVLRAETVDVCSVLSAGYVRAIFVRLVD